MTQNPVLVRARTWAVSVPGHRYWAALLLVALSVVIRLWLQPYIVNGYGFTCFYPAVILSAYWLGARPAMLAAAISASIVYLFMGPQPLSLHLDGRTGVGIGFFVISSALLIYVLGSIRARFEDLLGRHRHVELLVREQAELFRDHARRTTDHLQLVSAILQLKSREEIDPAAAEILGKAASRSLVISRAHRDTGHGGPQEVEFGAFARQLVEASAQKGGIAANRVDLGRAHAILPVEQAGALGVVLLEYLGLLGGSAPGALVAVEVLDRLEGRALRLEVSETETLPSPHSIVLASAMVEQLQGVARIETSSSGACMTLSFPRGAEETYWSNHPLLH